MQTTPQPSTSLIPPAQARHRVRRAADRAHYDQDTIHSIVDAAYVCHVSWHNGSQVLCIPTACWRIGDHLYIHGSNGSRMMQELAGGAQACVAITLLDGLVLAKSAFSHSMNYRSVVIHGAFTPVSDAAKPAALAALVEWVLPGRSKQARPADANELAATTVLAIPLAEAASKIRNGGPKDKEADLKWPCWSGVLPMKLQAHPPEPCAVTSRRTTSGMASNTDAESPSPIDHWSTGDAIRN